MKTTNLTLFHGSKDIIDHPNPQGGKLHNDYGRGFYTTEDADLAREWSVDLGRDGFLNQYSLDLTNLKLLNLNQPEYSVLHWLTILLQNRTFDVTSDLGREGKNYLFRNFSLDLDDYDLIRGYRADDSYFSYAQGFLNNSISLQTLTNALRLGNLGEQIFLKNEKAFEQLTFVSAEPVSANVWYPMKEKRDRQARSDYASMKYGVRQKGDIYLVNLMDESGEE